MKIKKKNITDTIKIINNRLDLNYILNKLVEIDKLKMLMLDEN